MHTEAFAEPRSRCTMILRHAHRLQPLAWGLAVVLATAALAQTSPYYIGASQSLTYDSNLLRLADGASAPAGLSKSSLGSTTALLAGIDQPISRQRVFGNVALRANRYSGNSLYNNESWSGVVGLDWATVERLSGNISASANRALASFNQQEIGLIQRKNFEDTRTLDASLNVGLVTQYSLLASLGRREVEQSLDLPAAQSRNFEQNTASLGLQWRPSSKSSFGVALRQSEGKYPQFRALAGGGFEADRYTRRDLDLTASLEPTGLSTVSARLSTGKIDYDLATRRNFSGVTGTLAWNWQATGKVRVNTTLTRDTGQDSYAVTVFNTPGTADYSRVTTSLSLGADYAATSKVQVNAGFSMQDSDRVGTLPSATSTLTNDNGSERAYTFTLGARWRPTRSVLVGCNANAEKRKGSGNLVGNNINSNSLGCYGQFTLQ
jgi:hypothetical protein